MGVMFVAGVYGVGKSTLCEQLSVALQKPYFSAGDLISKNNGERYGSNKIVSDKEGNQEILAIEVQKIIREYPEIILAGHFCIFTIDNNVDHLPKSIFDRLYIENIILLEADTERILSNLLSRDKRKYTHSQICRLQEAERVTANDIAKKIGCELFMHKMRFDGSDFAECLSVIKRKD